MKSSLLIILRTVGSVLLVVAWMVVFLPLMPWRNARYWWMARGAAVWVRLLGIRIIVHQRENLPKGGGLVVANHGNFFDPLILGSLFPRFFPVAKAEVRKLPLFGWLASLTWTYFIDRDARSPKVRKAQADEIRKRLPYGPVILFAEATSTAFLPANMQPFKRLLPSVVVDTDIPLVPVTLALTEADRQLFAWRHPPWYNVDESMFTNMARWMGQGVTVHVIVHPPRCLTEKDWAHQLKSAENEVRHGMETILAQSVAQAA